MSRLCVAVLVAVMAVACDTTDHPVTTSAASGGSSFAPSSTTSTIPLLSGWTKVADVPLAMIRGWIVQPIDRGMVIVGNESTTVIDFDGAAVNGDGPPLGVWPTPGCCGSVVAIPVGDRLVLFDAYVPGTWVLDPDTISWDQVGDRPSKGDVLGSALIGDRVYVVTASPRVGGVNASVDVLDTGTWEWSEIEDVPAGIAVGGVTADGDRLIVAGVAQDTHNMIIGDRREPVVYQYQGGVWSQLPDAPLDGQAATVAWVEGAGLLAWNYDLASALMSADGEWTALGTVPMDRQECYPYGFQVENGLVAVCGGLAYFDAQSESWSPISTSFEAVYVAAENTVYELAPSGDSTRLSVHELPTADD